MKKNSKKSARKSGQTKSAKFIALLQRNAGASIAELEKVVGWQSHSVRGFMSGTVKKKLGFEIVNEVIDGVRRYRIVG